jgi:hypothetical protein
MAIHRAFDILSQRQFAVKPRVGRNGIRHDDHPKGCILDAHRQMQPVSHESFHRQNAKR